MSDPLAVLVELEGVASGFAATRDGIDALLRDRGLRRTAPELTAASLLKGAHASAVLEGSASALERVEAGTADETASAAVRVSIELMALAAMMQRAPMQVLARLHTLAGKGIVDDADLGRPIQGADRMRALAQLLTSSTGAPALLVAAVAHAEVLTAAPFASHNGIVARALERILLVARGVDPTALIVPEAGHLSLRAEYESNLRGYAIGGRQGVHSWLLYASQAYAAGANASPLNPAL
ncbi:MAG: oxidoreductase [Nocardioidaceae bacterium]|nr:MAG: oxidoreductase [Nocardioidaceae bacterium]